MIPRHQSKSGEFSIWRSLVAALILCAMCPAMCLPMAAQDASSQTDINEAHAAYLERSDLQLERPEEPPEEIVIEPPRERPGWAIAFGRFLDSIFGALAPLLQILFWLVVAGVIGGVLYFIFSEVARARLGGDKGDSSKQGDDVIIDVRPDEATARTLLEEADALARAGKFAEAVHLLLFRSIEDIQTRLDGGVPRSLTAREIGGLGLLPDRARTALSPIIRLVERSFFGGQDVDEGGWTQARASYESFAFGEGWT